MGKRFETFNKMRHMNDQKYMKKCLTILVIRKYNFKSQQDIIVYATEWLKKY